MIIVDEIGLGARMTHRHPTVLKFLPLLLFMHFLFLLFRNYGLFDIELAEANQVIDEVLRDLHRLLGVEQGLFMPVQLGKKRTNLHMDLAFIF